MDPRIIKTEADYKLAMKEAGRLIAMDPSPGTSDAERLDLISLLIENYEKEYFPFELPSAIDAIKFRMEEQGLKQRDLSPFIGNRSKVSEVLSGKRALTIQMVRALNKGLRIPLGVLMQEQRLAGENEFAVDWERFPLKDMLNKGWLKATSQELRNDRAVLLEHFFTQIGGTVELPSLCRRTFVERSGKTMDRYALLAWTARVLIKAKDIDLPPYRIQNVDDNFFRALLALSRKADGPKQAQQFLHEHGIGLLVVSHLPRTHLDGAAILALDGKPIIGLTLRYDRVDNFWFNLLHELVHVWKHLKSPEEAFIDDLDSAPGSDKREKEADNIANEILIPRSIWKRSDAYRRRTPEAIVDLASKLNIHPAIVAGRIRHDTKNYYILSQMVGAGQVRKFFPNDEWK